MPIDEYTISSLTLSSGITNDDLLELATPDPSSETGHASVSATVVQLASYMLKNILFASDLNTTNKTIIGAINEVLAGGGASIMYGTSAPTAQQGSNGNLYVQYTAGTGGADDTVDALYVKLDNAWCEISTGGGGGASSADEVSFDDTNVAFEADDAQEAFENITKSLTWAEYQALSSVEKNNGTIYLITDVNGDGQDFQPVIYSEDEREIGVWTDGKPLYEKTLNLNVTASGDEFDISNLHIDTMVQVVGFIHQTGGNNPSVPYSSSPTDYALPFYSFSDDSIHVIFAGSYNQTTWVVTIRYTKTTDTAGSGQWTPQGVPAHHYSEDEQVVGTWIDGSTIYEKTFFLSQRTSITNDYTTYIIDDITIYDIDNIISCEVFDNNSDSAPLTRVAYLERAVDVLISSDKLIAYYPTNNAYKMTGFILRYTKSSS